MNNNNNNNNNYNNYNKVLILNFYYSNNIFSYLYKKVIIFLNFKTIYRLFIIIIIIIINIIINLNLNRFNQIILFQYILIEDLIDPNYSATKDLADQLNLLYP